MTITVDQCGVIFKDDNPIITPRDGNYDTISFLGGFDENDDIVFAEYTADRRLKVDTEISFDGNLKIGAVEIEDRTGGSTLRLDVAPIGGTSSGADNNHGILSMGVDDNGLVQALPMRDLGGGDFAVAVDIQDAELTINTDGEPLTLYGEQIAVDQIDGEVTVVTYTVPANHQSFVRHVSVSGENIATWKVKIGAAIKAKKRTYFTDYNADFFFGGDMSQGMKAVAGEVVTVTVEHERGMSGDFNATLYVREEDS